MKKLTLILLSIVMALLLGRYYSLIPRKMLMEYILAACLSVKFINNNAGDLITIKK